jgi:hypothetical protein
MEFTCGSSQYVNIINEDGNLKELYIGTYLRNYKAYRDKELKCIICNNTMIKYESKLMNKLYFKHKNYCCMTEWHREWQNNFDEKEIHIGKKIADAIIREDTNIIIDIEFQHSNIKKEEVDERGENCKVNNIKLYWVIDGNASKGKDPINIINISNNRFILEFTYNNSWKYANFISNDIIFINVEDNIYKIRPSLVKNKMVEINGFKTKTEFITDLKNNMIYEDELPPIQSYLYHNQRGAGCGKTFESIQLLNDDPRFNHKRTFIYLTKAHSAKEVIANEFMGQFNNGMLSNIEDIDDDISENKKQYKINYKKNEEDYTIIIGTIDSFIWSISKNRSNGGNNFFQTLVKSISDAIEINNNISYAQSSISLNKKCLIIIDEAQDLEVSYIYAMFRIMRDTYIDVYTIGDKLQSLYNEENIHTFLEHSDIEFPNLEIIKDLRGINKVMRFHNIQFKDFVNDIVNFEQYGLPPIEHICTNENCKYRNCDGNHEDEIKPYTVFETNNLYDYKSDTDKDIDNITKYMDQEIERYNYLPNNFMFIFPIVNMGFLDKLLAKLQLFWIHKFNKDENYKNMILENPNAEYWRDKLDDEYYQYSHLHKSVNGQPINLKESENATRIVSIHASKGNGCEVVFLLGLTESSISKKWNNSENNLKYESLLHVALTRQKKSLYVGIYKNGDNINKRFEKYIDYKTSSSIEPKLDFLSKKNNIIKITEIIMENEQLFNSIRDNDIIQFQNFEDYINIEDDKKLIDWGHHLIRKTVLKYYIHYNLYKYNHKKSINNQNFDQMRTVYYHISTYTIQTFGYKEYYQKINRNISSNNNDKKTVDDKILPILHFDIMDRINSKYNIYLNDLKDKIKIIQKKIKASLKEQNLPDLDILECVILNYLLCIVDGKNNQNIKMVEYVSIMDVYKIMNIFDCIKQELGTENDLNINDEKFYKTTKKIHTIMNNYFEKLESEYPDEIFIYNIDHSISLKFDNLSISNNNNIIAYSDKYIIDITHIPQFTAINMKDIIIRCFLQYFLINLVDGKNKRYIDKKIITCIISLSSESPIFYEFTDIHINFMNEFINDILFNKYLQYHNQLYDFFIYYYNFNKLNCIEIILEQIIKYKNNIKNNSKYIEYINGFFDLFSYDDEDEDDKEEKMKNIISIVDKNNFINKLNKELKKILKRELRVLKLLPVILSEIDINLEDQIIEQKQKKTAEPLPFIEDNTINWQNNSP